MQNKNKKRWNYWWGYSLHSPEASQSLTKMGYHRCCKFKEKSIWEEKILMLWILLSRNTSTNTKSFYHNSWKMKFILSTQRASRAPPGYTVYIYIFFLKSTSPSPHPPTPHARLPQKWSARQTVEFPKSRSSFVMQHVLHVPATGNISGQIHVLCIRNFVTYAGLMQTGKWPLLKIRGQWAMRFPDISVTTAFGSVSYRQSLFTTGDYSTEITSKLTFQCLYSNLFSWRGLLQSKLEWNVTMETKH